MNRWDWIRGIVGATGQGAAASNAALIAQVSEGFENIRNTLTRFETEIAARMDMAREEIKGYVLAVNAKIRGIERRLEILEEILFEPDPGIRQEKISALRPSPDNSQAGFDWQNDKNAA
jgi:hypothetical protein